MTNGPGFPRGRLRMSKNPEIFRHRKGRSLRKKPIRSVFRRFFRTFQVLKNRKDFFDKLRITHSPAKCSLVKKIESDQKSGIRLRSRVSGEILGR